MVQVAVEFSKEPGDYIRASACDIGLIWQELRPTQSPRSFGSRQ